MMRLVFAKAAETKGDLADVQAKIDEVHRAVRSLRQGSLRPEPVWEGSPNEDGGAPLGVEHQHGANGTLSEEEDVQKLRNRISELEMHSEELRENLSVARVQLSTYREEAAQLAEFEANELAKMLAGPGKQTRSSTHVLGGLSKRNGAASATTVQLQGDQQNVLSFNTCANPSEPPSAVPVATVSAIRCEPPTFWEVAPRANGDAAGSPGERPQAGRPTNPKVSALSMLRKQQDVQRAIVAPHPQPARPATRFAVL
jgi:ribosomal protein S15P/S13E